MTLGGGRVSSGHLRKAGFPHLHPRGTLWVVLQRQWEDTLLLSLKTTKGIGHSGQALEVTGWSISSGSKEALQWPTSQHPIGFPGPPVPVCHLTTVFPTATSPHTQGFPFCVQSQLALHLTGDG